MRPSGTTAARPRGRALIGLVVGGVLVLSGCATVTDPAELPTPPSGASSPAPGASPPEGGEAHGGPSIPAPAASPPTNVSIDSIGLAAPLIELGIRSDGGMEVPENFDDVGWFTGGGVPGGRGPVVIAAHVDSPTGPAAFIDLERVAVGDVISVTTSDGGVHDYRVVRLEEYRKDAFPTAAVFGATAADELRLVTCSGVFDPRAASYESNLVVFADRE